MDDAYEISSLLDELASKEASSFFVFNEIRNIIVDQRSRQDQEKLLLYLLKNVDPEYRKELFSVLAFTQDPYLNRMVIYELQDLITELQKSDCEQIMHNLLSVHTRLPADTKHALDEQGFIFILSVKDLWELLKSAQWQKILLFEKEIAELEDETLETQKEQLLNEAERLDAALTQTIHGETVAIHEGKSIFTILKRNPRLHSDAH